MGACDSKSEETARLLARLRNFCLPGGEECARSVRSARTTESGEMRMSPEARWVPFTAEEVIDATCSSFRWEARLDPSKFGSPTVIDAYEEGHGYLAVKVGGIPVKRVKGLDADRGELQRYLGSVMLCPAILLNHPSLEWRAVSDLALQVRDRIDPTGATMDLEITEQGCPMMCRAERPRQVGKKAVLTAWSGSGGEFREWEGMRVASRVEAAWHLPEGWFTYYRAEIKSFTALRQEK
jgi:hypothetical protein